MKNANISECKFSADMVSYMYGELSESEGSALELHLVDCAECVDEFAAVSSARYEVYDWKHIEFDPLETPRFEVSYDDAVVPSWSDKLRAVFAQSWAVPAFSFAALAIVSVLVIGLAWMRSGDEEIIAENPPSQTVAVPAKDVVKDEPESLPTVGPRIEVTDQKPIVATAAKTKASLPKPHVAPKIREVPATTAVSVKGLDPKQATAKNEVKAAPTLNAFDDEEDTSLRLAELFEDLGTR
ncbi:MAG: hypothetical protein DMF63_12895 [Acidobacteria bacterium]|nr:MAG: hypothetical protein DMF63_12895 [Acidobacteriota bacterium]